MAWFLTLLYQPAHCGKLGNCSYGEIYVGETIRNLEVCIAEHNDPKLNSEPAQQSTHQSTHTFQWKRQERKSHKSVQILAEPGIKLGTLWSKGRDLTNCANHARPVANIMPTKIRSGVTYHSYFTQKLPTYPLTHSCKACSCSRKSSRLCSRKLSITSLNGRWRLTLLSLRTLSTFAWQMSSCLPTSLRSAWRSSNAICEADVRSDGSGNGNTTLIVPAFWGQTSRF